MTTGDAYLRRKHDDDARANSGVSIDEKPIPQSARYKCHLGA